MNKYPLLGAWVSLSLLTGCAASSQNVQTLVLPTSNKSIDVVLSRSDVKFLDCGTLVVLQTYNTEGSLIDSKEARGNALHCDVLTAGIQAGGMVGAASVLRPSRTNIDNNNEQSQTGSSAVAGAVSNSASSATSAAVSTSSSSSGSSSSAKGGTVHWKPKGSTPVETSHDKPKGNNGYGNGGHDGSPNGKEDSDR